MLKELSKLLNTLLGLYFISIIFSSCEAEKDFVSKSNIIIKHCSMKDIALQSNLKLKQAVKQLVSLQVDSNANSKVVYDELSGLYYDDEKGIYIKKDGKESYTFPVIQTDNNEKIKNITFNKNINK